MVLAVTILLWVCVALGFAAGFVPRGWLAIPLAVVVGVVPPALNLTWDDGEPIAFLSVWTLVWPIMTALGYVLHRRLQARRSGRKRLSEPEDLDRVT